MADRSPYIVGGLRIPSKFEEENGGRRIYHGIGDPNLLMGSANEVFAPPPRPGDRYMQLDEDPVMEWVFTIDGHWVSLSTRYDRKPPDYTLIIETVETSESSGF